MRRLNGGEAEKSVGTTVSGFDRAKEGDEEVKEETGDKRKRSDDEEEVDEKEAKRRREEERTGKRKKRGCAGSRGYREVATSSFASGGGFSNIFPRPRWQTHIVRPLRTRR